ncbi:MAG: cob(I)alamin adenosyltransferase [Actinomycetota bacterium]|nr:cob(I)alamin adenosyltransferase [Actinomycetota bacterium]
MVNLTRIYTRTGDDGTTALGDLSRTRKTDPRLVAYADVDEANSLLGLVIALDPPPQEPVGELLVSIQNDLFDVGADLCTPWASAPKHPPLRITEDYITRLEKACDEFNSDLAPLRSFVLPGGSPVAARLHLARAVTRRAERSVWAALELYGTQSEGGVNPWAARYLNRLSDLLFVLCRWTNREAGDVMWTPGANR